MGTNYLSVFLFFALSVVIAVIVFAAKFGDKEKLSSYECGFNPFEDSRGEFDIKFYLVAILFIIFDLEIGLLFPFALCLGQLGSTSIFAMYFFLIVLTVGFLYEWKMGALDWD